MVASQNTPLLIHQEASLSGITDQSETLFDRQLIDICKTDKYKLRTKDIEKYNNRLSKSIHVKTSDRQTME